MRPDGPRLRGVLSKGGWRDAPIWESSFGPGGKWYERLPTCIDMPEWGFANINAFHLLLLLLVLLFVLLFLDGSVASHHHHREYVLRQIGVGLALWHEKTKNIPRIVWLGLSGLISQTILSFLHGKAEPPAKGPSTSTTATTTGGSTGSSVARTTKVRSLRACRHCQRSRSGVFFCRFGYSLRTPSLSSLKTKPPFFF